uniref:SEM1 26S proteasome complex subunit n=1 Tax=Macaca mulatta TaxID=9544 RepID=F7DR96_MACMU
MYCQDPNVCAVFAVQGGKVGRKHGIKRGRRPSMQNPAQQARGPWIHESKHPAFAKQQINLEMPSSGVTTERACVCRSLTLPTAPLSPAPSLVHCEDCSCLPGCHLGDLYNLATAERTCW